ncbi:ATP-binding protein [Microbacterium sp. P02]|uniref:sensor histidine kinase n=1 Tax=Microbacterium sp. P02 TaxID=3366260 RepID=UPI00366F9C7E
MSAAETTVDTPDPAPTRSRKPISLQARLMIAIIGFVALILTIIAIATATLLGGVLQDNLSARVVTSAQQLGGALLNAQYPGNAADVTAYDILQQRPTSAGILLVTQTNSLTASNTTGAYIDADGEVQRLTNEQVTQVIAATTGPATGTVAIEGLGEYRITTFRAGGDAGIAGLPLSDVNSTIEQMLITVALVTAGGLLVLAAVIALVIRAGLRPLRAVADTATRVAALPLDQGRVSIAERVPAAEADDRTEIGRVGAALNTLLDHVDTSLDARQANEERMRTFVADASHELRTPLASIRGYSELSLRDTTLSETSESALQRIQAQSLRMTTLVEDLLLLARLDEGQELVYGSVDLTRLALEAVGDARPAGPDHRWILDLAETPVVIAGDTARLHQVMANLLANARTHTPAGTEVTVGVALDGDRAVLRVHDDGPGIDPSIAEDLFERFARADRSRARKTGGTGLGLSIARAIVEAHHGTVSVRSVPGDTTFEVRLPAAPAAPSADAGAAAVAGASASSASAETSRVASAGTARGASAEGPPSVPSL